MLAKQISGAAAAASPVFVEDTFSSYLYTGNGSTQTITNGIDLSGKGGLVWIKSRSAAENHFLFDTARGANAELNSDTTDASTTLANSLTAFNGNGFSVGSAGTAVNTSAATYASWTFRKQAKFFDVVTYTGNGASSQAISHALGSTPGCVIVKRTDSTGFWLVWHRGFSSPSVSYGYLNRTDPFQPDSPNNNWAAAPTSTTFTPASNYNANGGTYVAYLFAHDAGGFGLTGTDNVISCGSFTTDGSGNATVNLGYEPQWLLAKRVDTTGNWELRDSMRPWPIDDIVNGQAQLFPNLSNAESNSGLMRSPTATGFAVSSHSASATYIYIAIRRGPMKVPTSGTSVFSAVARTGTGADATITSGNVTDLIISRGTNNENYSYFVTTAFTDRLRGALKFIRSNNSGDAAEDTGNNTITSFANMTGVNVGSDAVGFCNISTIGYVNWMFRRAPSFFDEVCYSGTGSAQTVTHNLGVAPELLIVKSRNNPREWAVYSATLTATKYLNLNTSSAGGTSSAHWNNTSPTSTVFTVGTDLETNGSGWTYTAYLFGTCPGVSKVGSYTGTGTTQQINCGFTGGARFVLIKRTDVSGGWYVWDSARGIVAGNDPYLVINTLTVQVTNTDYIDTYSAGFEISSTAPADINANGGTYIFLAIA